MFEKLNSILFAYQTPLRAVSKNVTLLHFTFFVYHNGYFQENDDLDNCQSISDIRDFLANKLDLAELELEEIGIYLKDKTRLPTTIEVRVVVLSCAQHHMKRW